MIDQMLARDARLRIIVTANTCTGRDLVRAWDDPRIRARLAPLDYTACVRRFLAAFQPLALVTLENELWPVRISACARAGCEVLVVGARMSPRSAALWARFPALARRLMAAISGLWPLDGQNADRFMRLGLARARLHAQINLKSGVEIAARALKAEALAFSRRTQTPDPGPQDLVYLADTIGEMALWYSAAAITIVAGSFADKGGHTPFEPVRFGSVVVHGPDTANHAQAYGALRHANGARCVRDADELAQALVELSGAKSHHDITSRATRALAQIRQSQPIPESLLTSVDALIGTDS